MLHHDNYEKPWEREEKPKKELPSKKRKKEKEPEVQLWRTNGKLKQKDLVTKLSAAKRIVSLYKGYEYTIIEEKSGRPEF